MAKIFDSLQAGSISRTFVQCLNAFCSQQEAASDVISGKFVRLIVPNKCVKFWDTHLKYSGEIRPKAIEVRIIDSIFTITSDPK